MQTRTGQNAVALCVVFLIGFAFLFGLHPFRKNEQLSTPSAKWEIRFYFIYVSALIQASTTIDELNKTKKLVNSFYHQSFKGWVSRKKRKNYNARILEAYYTKEVTLSEKVTNRKRCVK